MKTHVKTFESFLEEGIEIVSDIDRADESLVNEETEVASETVEVNEETEAASETVEVNEALEQIALGVMLAYLALKAIPIVGKKIIGMMNDRTPIPPDRMKELINQVVVDAVSQASSFTGASGQKLGSIDIRNAAFAEIDAGRIKTLGDLKSWFKKNYTEVF